MNEVASEVQAGGKIFITSKGIALELVGVSPLLIAKLQSVGTLPDVPTREVPLDFGDGSTQRERLSKDDLQTEEEKIAWEEYEKKRDAILAKRNNGFMKAVFAKGVNVDLSRLGEWKEEMSYFDIEISEHPLDQKVEFIQTEAIGNADDMVEIITGVLGQSGIPEEELANVRAMFRNSIRRRTSGETIDPDGEVEMEPELYGDAGGPLLGDLASERLLQGE